jgi:hypothetical protein
MAIFVMYRTNLENLSLLQTAIGTWATSIKEKG